MAKKRRKGTTKRAAKRGFRRASRGVRRFARRARSIRLSILGKSGIAVATIPPVGFAALDALAGFLHPASLDLPTRLRFSLANFVDSLSLGFTGAKVFTQFQGNKTDGSVAFVNTIATSPSGGWQKTTLIGATMVVYDAIQSALLNFMAKKKGVRVAGMQLTTGR